MPRAKEMTPTSAEYRSGRLRYLAPVFVVLALVAAAPAGATVSPCKLVTTAEAVTVLGFPVTKKAESIGNFDSCMYKHGKLSFLQIETRSISKADFIRSAKSNMRPVTAVKGIGSGTIAYSAAFVVLLVWRNGHEATFLLNEQGKSIADTEKLAKRVISRL